MNPAAPVTKHFAGLILYQSIELPAAGLIALISCYTDFVPKNITIKISEEGALWARRKAAEENTSVSRLVGQMLEREMRLSDEYWRAFEHWKSIRPRAGQGAAERMSREETHDRG